MKKLNFLGWMPILFIAAGLTFTACDDDDDDDVDTYVEDDTDDEEEEEAEEEEEEDATTSEAVWTTDEGLNACDHILFSADNVVDDEGTQIGNGDQEFVFTGTQTLAKGTYSLKGWVYIGDGATLTIEAGTIIKGDKQTKAAIIVERGGKLYAEGTVDEPIVFTSEEEAGSRKPGDWGGVILCGKAYTNQDEQQIEGGPRTQFGGTDDSDNSGILSYVRIEFAGYPFQTDKEINGLTMGSVGSGTQIDHIQVSYSNDDSFEWFGGAVNCSYLIAYKGWDDDFDTDNGFSGNVQFCLSVRDSRIADTSQSNGFESDNCADGSAVTPFTDALFSNVTFVGPYAVDDDFENTTDYITGGDYNPNNGSSLGRFQSAMQIRRGSQLRCVNSVALGWPIGMIIDSEKGDTRVQAEAGNLTLQNIWFAGMQSIGSDANKVYGDSLLVEYDENGDAVWDNTQYSYSHTFFLSQSGNNYLDNISDLMLEETIDVDAPIMPQAASPLLSADVYSLGSDFTSVDYIGAFTNGDTWLDGWTNFDPQNTEY